MEPEDTNSSFEETGDQKPQARSEQIRSIVADVIQQRADGEALTDDVILAKYPDLMPELAKELKKAAHLEEAKARADADGPTVETPPADAPTSGFVPVARPEGGANLIGRQFADYKIVDHIGAGGMGTVWRAVQSSTQRTVALKMLDSRAFSSSTARTRFRREVELTALIEHPNIASIYEAGTYEGVEYYAMEYIEGETLLNYIRAQQLDQDAILQLMLTICRAVAVAHRSGIIHRDLKPDNILVKADGTPVVLDFGLAKSIGEQASHPTLTQEGAIAGTPAYMAPEQAKGDVTKVDMRSDVYTLGVILQEALFGVSPHILGDTQFEILRRIVEGEIRSPKEAHKQISNDLNALLLKALSLNPDDRYDTAGELANDLQRYLSGDPLSAQPATAIYFVKKALAKHRVLTVSVLSGFALIVVAVVFYLYSIKAEQSRTELARQDAVNQQGIAQRNESFAKAETKRATKAETEAKAETERARRAEYAKLIGLAQVSIDQANIAYARLLLDSCLVDLRHYEWYRLRAVMDDSVATLPVGGYAVLSSDGKRIVSGSPDKNIRVWDAERGGDALLTLHGHEHAVNSVALSANGKRIVSASYDNTIKVWDAEKGGEALLTLSNTLKKKGRLFLHEGIRSIAISADGKRIASGHKKESWKEKEGEKFVNRNESYVVRVWDAVKGGKALLTLRGHEGDVNSVAFSSDGKRIVSGSRDMTIKVWDAQQSGKLLLTLRGHGGWVLSVAFSSDGNRIVSSHGSDDDGVIKVWDANEGGEPLLTLGERLGGVGSVAISADGKRIVSGSRDKTIKVWDANNGGEALLTLRGHEGNVASVAISADGKRIVSGGSRIKIWDAGKSGEKVLTLRGHSSVNSVAISANGKRIVSGGFRIKIWDAEKGGESLHTLGRFPGSLWVAISRDGSRIVSGGLGSKVLNVWNAKNGGEALTLYGHENSVRSVAFSADGKRIVSGSDDKTIKVWDAEKGGEALLTLRGHEHRVGSLAISADGKRIVSGSDDQTIKVWDANNGGDALLTLRGHSGGVNSVAFSVDGKRIVSADDDDTIKVWDANKGGEPLLKMLGHENSVISVAFSADGKRIVSGGWDKTIKVWDAEKGSEALLTLRGHEKPVTDVTFSADGKRIVSGSYDGTVKVWGTGDWALLDRQAMKRQLVLRRDRQLMLRRELIQKFNIAYKLGEFGEAVMHSKNLISLSRILFGNESDEVVHELRVLADVHEEQGECESAIKLREDVVAIQTRRFGKTHWHVVDAKLALAGTRNVANLTKAEMLKFAQAIELNVRAIELYKAKQFAEAARLAERVLKLREPLLGEDHPFYARSINSLADMYRSMGDYAKAEPLLRRLLEIRKKTIGVDHPAYQSTKKKLVAAQKLIANCGFRT